MTPSTDVSDYCAIEPEADEPALQGSEAILGSSWNDKLYETFESLRSNLEDAVPADHRKKSHYDDVDTTLEQRRASAWTIDAHMPTPRRKSQYETMIPEALFSHRPSTEKQYDVLVSVSDPASVRSTAKPDRLAISQKSLSTTSKNDSVKKAETKDHRSQSVLDSRAQGMRLSATPYFAQALNV